jgi:hypothetical protein
MSETATLLPPGSLELAWSLRERVMEAINAPLHELEKGVGVAADGPALAEANEPARFQHACMRGMAAVTDLALDEALPLRVRDALRALPGHYQELLTILLPAAAGLTAAAPELRGMKSLEGVAGLLHTATQAANPGTPVGVAAIGGATLGTLVMPGVGTVIGGAVGMLLGGRQVGARDRIALQRFADATRTMWAAVDELRRALWNLLVRSLREGDGPRLPDAAFFETADLRAEAVRVPPRSSDAPGQLRQVETYLNEWGPHPEVLALAARLSLPPYPVDRERASRWVALHRRLYPADPAGFESAGRLGLEEGDFEGALRAADAGLAAGDARPGLREVRLEALAALGRVADAEEAGSRARQAGLGTVAELALVRGLLRGGSRAEAVEAVRAWARRDRKPALIAQQLLASAPTALLLAEGAAPIPELASLPGGAETELQAAVERHLAADGAQSFLGAPPADRSANAREAFLRLLPDERVLYFYDWSLWHNGRTGLALTNRRLLWKTAWQDPVAVDLRHGKDLVVRAEKAELRIGDRVADVGDEGQAGALARAVTEMVAVMATA